MGKRDELKARALARNAKRAEANTAATIAVDPAAAKRSRIRAAHLDRQMQERRRATRLMDPLRDPAPDATVQALLEQAEGQRRAAAVLDAKADADDDTRERREARRERKVFLNEAKRIEIAAAAARARQLADHRRAMDAREREAQGRIRAKEGEADEMEDVITEVSDWDRNQDGNVIYGRGGTPTLVTERSAARRQANGLDRALAHGKITKEQHRIGKEAARIWLSAAQAAEPGRAEFGSIGGGNCKAPAGPADWRLTAMNQAKQMEVAITSYLQEHHGAAVVATCRSICRDGYTITFLSEGNRYEAVRREEHLKLGLALIRYWLYTSPAKITA